MAYDEIVHWKCNLFQVPSGSSGKALVLEISRLYRAYVDCSSLESVALKACSVLVALALQKPSRTSKSKDHVSHLNRRFALWKEGSVSSLLDEGRCIQKHLQFCGVPNKDKAARTFNHLMLQGKVHAALRYLSCHSSGGVLDSNAQVPERSPDGSEVLSTTRKILLDKHPLGKPPDPSILLPDPAHEVNSILFDGLDADAIRAASLHTNGAAGPSGLDATAWRRLCCSFKSASVTLCSALATVGHRICTEAVHPDGLTAFVACRLIPLDKQPGVRPIGIGEVPWHIVAKAVLRLVDMNIREACGALQVCAGCEGGCEAAVHAVRQLYRDPSLQAVLLVDASNAFNSVNRQAALHNILRLCPPLARILINTYQSPVRLIIPGSGGLVSTEGTTQGDPLAMAMYAFGSFFLLYIDCVLLTLQCLRYGMLMMPLVLVLVLP